MPRSFCRSGKRARDRDINFPCGSFEARASHGAREENAGGSCPFKLAAEDFRFRVQRDDRAAVTGPGQFRSQRAMAQRRIDQPLVCCP